jgi:uncharacterized 2Fe-2S/4Fe-4S cluster protein (DUF4445 family)
MAEKTGLTSYRVDLEPVGRRAEIAAGGSLLDAARSAGVDLVAICGGEGWCYSCVVRLLEGTLSPATDVERDALGDRLAQGYRLACQALPQSDVKLDIPPESLATQQRLQIEGQELPTLPDPRVVPVDVEMAPPTLEDLRSDATRLADAVEAVAGVRPEAPHPVLRELSCRLRELNWCGRAALRDGRLVSFVPRGGRLAGLAVDIGTTKVAAYLVDLATGATLAKAGAVNPQIAYGEDVVSRIGYTNEHDDGRAVLQSRMANTLNETVAALCTEAGVARDQVVDAVIVGNTAMHHLFAGLPVIQLGRAPYVAAVSDPLDIEARDLGLALAPGAHVHLPANIAGYVGADHVAMALATGAWTTGRTVVALDIGTNTEVTLTRGGRSWCCSCASGPAFEGAHIHDGMRAAPGAVERVQMVDGAVHLKTIENAAPVGICGSGILDAISELLHAGYIDRKGSLREGAAGVSRGEDNMLRFLLAPASQTGHGRPLLITRKDVNEIQLAKAAIRTGVDLLLQEAGATYDDIEEFIVAGAFGTYLDIGASVRVGMFPPLPLSRFSQVGNAAGAGARQMLVSVAQRDLAARLARRVQYVELTVHPDFTKKYMKALYF